MSNTKQVIILRTKYPCDKTGSKKIRTGKLIAQACHASMSFLTRPIQNHQSINLQTLDKASKSWIESGFTKVCVYVESEEELKSLHEQAISLGLKSNLIMDKGLTEFNGVPTLTALAIGPDYSEDIDKVTKELPLL